MPVSKPNPLDATLWAAEPGEPDIPIGKVAFKELGREDGKVWLAGLVRNHSNQIIGKASIDGIPLSMLPASKGQGAPRKDEKRMAVFLAWALLAAKFGGKFGEADRQLVESGWFKTGCSAEGKVRAIRNALARTLCLDLDKDAYFIFDTSAENAGTPPFSVLIKKPTYYSTNSGGLEILGLGNVWMERMGERVSEQRALKVEIERLDQAFKLEAAKARGGPIIISCFRPGQ